MKKYLIAMLTFFCISTQFNAQLPSASWEQCDAIYGGCMRDADVQYWRAHSECLRQYWENEGCCERGSACCDAWNHPSDAYWWCTEDADNAYWYSSLVCYGLYLLCMS